jgi:hypothetical protein
VEVARRDVELRVGGGRVLGQPYVVEHDAVGNEAAAIQAVAESAVILPTWFSSWSGRLNLVGGDPAGCQFSVTIPGLTAVTGYLCQASPQTDHATFPKWDSSYSWPSAQAQWPSNVLRFRLTWNDYGAIPTYVVDVSVLAWGTR